MFRYDLDDGWYVLGGSLDPVNDAGLLFDAVRCRRCSGVAGLLFTEESVTDWPPELRNRIGWLLQQLPKVYAADEQTVEWGLHYGIVPSLGEHLFWIADLERVSMTFDATGVKSYEAAVLAARAHRSFYLRIHPRDGQSDSKNGRPDTYHLLHRFAAKYGVRDDRIIYGNDEAVAFSSSSKPSVDDDFVSNAQDLARKMLDEISISANCAGVIADLDRMLGGEVVEEKPSRRRRIAIGTVFDPKTHYQADYYDGTGVEYQQPDGSWTVYHGTGLKWAGNELVAKFIRQIVDPTSDDAKKPRLLDYGCSSGDFLSYMLDADWDAWGYDISKDAIDKASPMVRPRLSTEVPWSPDRGIHEFDHLTAWDLLEHIWHHEVPDVLAQFNGMLRNGGLLWLNICTCGEREQTYLMEPGVKFTLDNSWLLVSGHVTIHRIFWWRRRLREAGFVPRDDLANLWQIRRAETPGFVGGSPSWSARNFMVMEKR